MVGPEQSHPNSLSPDVNRIFRDEPHFGDITAPFYRETLLRMNSEELVSFIQGPLLNKENILYGESGNTIEHKLMFMIDDNVSTATIISGEPVVTSPKAYPKHSELYELREAIMGHLRGKRNISHVLSETGDIFHNLILASELQARFDREHSLDHLGSLGNGYIDHARELAAVVGLEYLDGLRASAVKFQFRLLVNDGAKYEDLEDSLVGSLMFHPSHHLVSIPTDAQLNQTYDYTMDTLRPFLVSRLNRVRGVLQSEKASLSG